MRRARPYILLVLFTAILVPGILVFQRHLQKQNKINAALWALVLHKNDPSKSQTAVSELATFGSAAYPQIALAFRDKYTLFDQAYHLAGRKLPKPLRVYVPSRPSRAELRRAVATSLYDLGPAASRALLTEIELGLKHLDGYEGSMLLRALYWSIPESPHAVQILSNYLAHPAPGKSFFGMRDARKIWARLPHLAPLLAPWLHQFDTTSEAAEALGLMGTNAAFAIPRLIEIAQGRSSPNPAEQLASRRGGTIDRLSNLPLINRAAAIEALGNIGFASPEVLDVLKEALTDSSDRIRNETALAFGNLGSRALPALDYFLANLDRENSAVLHHQLHALAQIGTNATAAVPLLLELSNSTQFSVLENFNRLPNASPRGAHSIWIWNNEPQPGMIAAALALTQIDLHSAKERLDVLLLALRNHVPTNVLHSLRAFKNDLVPQLEPHLNLDQPLGTLRPPFGPAGMPILRILLAHNILVLDPENQPARQLLHTAMTDTDPTMRSIAAKWFYTATGDTNKTLPIVAQSLVHVKTADDQALISVIADFGPHAKSLIPKLQPFLTHSEFPIRYVTGNIIRSIQ